MNRRSRQQESRSAGGPENGVWVPVYAPEGLAEGIDILSVEPVFAEILGRAGQPRFRRRRNGFGTLLHIILEQQVSIDAAAAMHRKLVGFCHPLAPEGFLALDDATLRSCGFSRQKMGYARHLAQMVASGTFDFIRLAAADDEAALADLGLQVAMGDHLGLGSRPGEIELRRRGEAWRPWRSVAACLFWQSYLHARGRAAPRLPAELYA